MGALLQSKLEFCNFCTLRILIGWFYYENWLFIPVGTVSVTKLDRFFVVSGLAYMVRFARHLEQIYF